MDRETFEQLVSQWLDQPDREDLRERIDLAVAADPELRTLLDGWVRFDRALRDATQASHAVDWKLFQQGIGSAIEGCSAEERVERRIRHATDITARVDWNRLRERITQAVHAESVAPRVFKFPRRVASALAVFAAAAAVVLMMTTPQWTPLAPPAPTGAARVRVTSAAVREFGPASYQQQVGAAARVARVTVSALPEGEAVATLSPNSSRKSAQPAVAEVFLMVEPLQIAVNAPGSLSPFEFN